MKKSIILFSFLVAIMATLESQAQYQAFSFVTKKDNGKVLTLDGDKLIAMPTHTKVGNKAIQQFVMKRLSNGNVLIVNVAYPEKCIKREGSTIKMATPSGSNTSGFEWRLDFAGNDLYLITDPSNTTKGLKIQSNNEVAYANISTFVNGNASTNDSFRFSLVTVANRF